jgi:hypothetical protein
MADHNQDHISISSIGEGDDRLVLGQDSDFETAWWRIEVGLWIFLTAVLICALSGLLGKGPLSHKEVDTPDQALEVRYERIAHYKSPSILTVRIRPELFRDGKAYLWLNRVIINDLGAQRVIPQPEQTFPGETGIAYLFPAEDASRPLMVSFALEPSKAGVFEQEIRTDPQHDLFLKSITLP